VLWTLALEAKSESVIGYISLREEGIDQARIGRGLFWLRVTLLSL
jgi:hypothetical protein